MENEEGILAAVENAVKWGLVKYRIDQRTGEKAFSLTKAGRALAKYIH